MNPNKDAQTEPSVGFEPALHKGTEGAFQNYVLKVDFALFRPFQAGW